MKLVPRLEGIIYDVDGVILRSLQHQYRWFKWCGEKYGTTRPIPRYNQAWINEYNDTYNNNGMAALYTMHEINFEGHSEEIWEDYNEYNKTKPPRIIRGMKETILEVHKATRISDKRTTRVKHILNTTKSWNDIKYALERADLTTIFDSRVTKDDIYALLTNGRAKQLGIAYDDYGALREIFKKEVVSILEKPNAYSAQLAVQRAGGIPENIIAIEDTASGVQTYKGVILPDGLHEIPVIATTFGYTKDPKPLREAGADIVVSSPEELTQVLLANAA